MTLGVTLVAITAVVGSLLTPVTPAHASESTLADARAAISSSVNHGTYADDIRSGKITVEQLVDVTMDLRSTGRIPNAGPIPSRAELTRQADEAVASLRAATAPPAAPTLAPSTGSPATTDPLREDKHWWNHLTHWFGFTVDAEELAGSGAAGVGVLGILVGGCAASGYALCAGLGFLAGAALVAFVVEAAHCLSDHHSKLYVSVPNFKASGCRD
jgi:hypothetical protein